jgi:hypothetical protein
MATVSSKLAITRIIVGAGVFLGALFLVVVLPVMTFTRASNETWVALIGATVLLLSVLPASVLAIYKPLPAGVWLTLVGLLGGWTTSWNPYRVLVASGAPPDYGEVVGSAFLCVAAVALGLFFLITALLEWPNLKFS